jgi:membrane-associated phospholipid phosphatase
MKRNFFLSLVRRLREPSRLQRLDLWLTLIPALLWALGPTLGRTQLIQLHCIDKPQTCTPESVFWLDRALLGTKYSWAYSWADHYSYMTQNLSGALAVGIPALLHGSLAFAGKMTPIGAMTGIATDLIIWGQTVAWNGMFTETARLIAQRPRPFVYKAPAIEGADPAHYTSFFSGHTSFAAASTAALFLILLARRAPAPLLVLSALAIPSLTVSTAVFRVLAQRHFVTDVIAGGLCGILVALAIALAHKPVDARNP